MEDGVVAQIAEAVIARDGGLDDAPGVQKGIVGVEIIPGHLLHRVVPLNELPSEPDEPGALCGLHGK